jgi:isovaleryl-CoA dehydrogenase
MFRNFNEASTPSLLLFGGDTQIQLRDAAADFAQRVIRPLDDKIDRETHDFPHELWAQMGEQGLLGIITPEEYGGMGLGYLALSEITKQISRNSGSIGLSYIAHEALNAHQIIKHGTPEQKQKYLPGLADGSMIGALAMSEPGAGSDVMSMKTNAKAVDGGFVLNGGKYWITNGGRIDAETGQPTTADVMVVYAATGNGKLTAFLLERGMEGFKAAAKIDKETMRGSETWEITFDNVFVPAENILGTVNKGAHVLMAGLNAERLILAAGALGLAEAACEEALPYTTERKQFGAALAYNQNLAFRLAQIYADITSANQMLLVQAALADKDIKLLDNAAAAAVFLKASQACTLATQENIQLHGGAGLTTGVRAMRLFRDGFLYRIGGGSEEVRFMRIAEETIPGYREFVAAQRAWARDHLNPGPSQG